MKRRQAVLVFKLQVRVHRQDVREGILSFAVAGPVQRRAPTVIRHVDIHVFLVGEIEEWTRLVTLCGHMKHVRAINISQVKISMHFLDH